jgi:uncharacterized protein (TIGR02996 family)
MTHDEAFLQAIRDAPDDDAPRLIYADWLEEHGQEARAELIRVQCELARPATDRERVAALGARAWRLLVENWGAWVGPLRELVGPHGSILGETWLMGGPHLEALAKFRRGFVESLALAAPTFVQRGHVLAGLLPLRRLRLWRAGPVADDLAACPYLDGLATLDFTDYYTGPLTAPGAWALARSPYLGRLRALHLYRNDVADDGLRALARAPWVAGLTHLNVVENGLSDVGARALAASPHSLRLTVLQAGHNRLGPAGAEALARATFLPGLAVLVLNHCDLGDAGVEALAAAPAAAGLTSLGLSGNGLTDRGARALAASPHLARLTTLGLQNNAITPAGEAALRASPHLRRLTALHL